MPVPRIHVAERWKGREPRSSTGSTGGTGHAAERRGFNPAPDRRKAAPATDVAGAAPLEEQLQIQLFRR